MRWAVLVLVLMISGCDRDDYYNCRLYYNDRLTGERVFVREYIVPGEVGRKGEEEFYNGPNEPGDSMERDFTIFCERI